MINRVRKGLVNWITYEEPNRGFPLCDFERLSYEVRPGDVLLIEGRSRVSEVIKQVTQSPWSHAALYVGRIHDIEDVVMRKRLAEHFPGPPNTQLVIEGYLGQGTIATPLNTYESDHIRICRPRGLSRRDAVDVIAYAIRQLGKQYDVRQIFDLWRFLVPWGVFPRRWRSSLFQHHVSEDTKTVCSTMIAEAFGTVDFPVLPVIKKHEETGIELFRRHPKLFTPRDFDYSPYFEIIKYPFLEITETGPYRNLPWNKDHVASIEGDELYHIKKREPDKKPSPAGPEPSETTTQTALAKEEAIRSKAKSDPVVTDKPKDEKFSPVKDDKGRALKALANKLNPFPSGNDAA